MAVYVDDMEVSFGRMKMSHMIADSQEELLEMADKIGVRRIWLQYPGTYKEHFDVSLSKRALAMQHGAILISYKELGMKVAQRKPVLN